MLWIRGLDLQDVCVERGGSPKDAPALRSAAEGLQRAASEGHRVNVDVNSARDQQAALERARPLSGFEFGC
jgi:hypothetical protein